MMKFTFISKIFAVLSMAILMGCSSDNEYVGSIPSDSCYDFATYQGVEDNSTLFSLQKSGDSALVSYYCSQKLGTDSGIETGDRLIIAYTPLEHSAPYISGQITLYGYRLLDNTSKRITVIEDKNSFFDSESLKIQSLTRTGNFINLQTQLSCAVTASPKKLELQVEADEMFQDFPTLHLVYEAQTPGENAMTGYASFDISEIWQRPTCKGVIIDCRGESVTFQK